MAATEAMMKRHLLSVFAAVCVVAAIAVVGTPAEAADITVRVPFGFVANGKTLPAGTYGLTSTNGVVWVRGSTDTAIASFPGSSAQVGDVKLVFHKYGEQYFLRQVSMGEGFVRNIQPSRLERQLLDSKEKAVTMQRVIIPVL
jgi:hypothetical protein